MGKIKKYPSYYNSQNSWPLEIPENWKLYRLKHVFEITKRIVGEFGHDVLSITQKGIKVKDTESGAGQLSMDYSKYQQVDKGDFAMNHMDLLTGFVDISKYDGVVSPDYRVFKLTHGVSDSNYLLYILQLCYTQKIFFGHGKGVSMLGRWRLPAENFKNFIVPIPPKEEQVKIAAFLDYKLIKIDRFIRKKKQLIKLLNEQKASIINNAVTKGINPKAKMKPSGIEWLGDIPEHWEVRKLKYLGTFQNGISASAEYFGTGYPFVSYGDVYKNIELPVSGSGLAKSSEQDRINYSVEKGDVFFTRTSETIEEIGFTSTCLSTIENATFSGFIIRFRPLENILFDGFSKYYFRSSLHRRFFVKEMNLVTRASLSQELLKRMPILLPSLEEQNLISDHIEKETTKLNQTISTIEKEIALTQEYRTALIAEAVTGKIDVRDFVIAVEKEVEIYEDLEEELSLAAEGEAEYETDENHH